MGVKIDYEFSKKVPKSDKKEVKKEAFYFHFEPKSVKRYFPTRSREGYRNPLYLIKKSNILY